MGCLPIVVRVEREYVKWSKLLKQRIVTELSESHGVK